MAANRNLVSPPLLSYSVFSSCPVGKRKVGPGPPPGGASLSESRTDFSRPLGTGRSANSGVVVVSQGLGMWSTPGRGFSPELPKVSATAWPLPSRPTPAPMEMTRSLLPSWSSTSLGLAESTEPTPVQAVLRRDPVDEVFFGSRGR